MLQNETMHIFYGTNLVCFFKTAQRIKKLYPVNPFLHGRRPLLAILSLGQTGKPYSCTMYTEFLLEVLVSRCFV